VLRSGSGARVPGERVPVVDELGLADELTDARADEMYADHRAGLLAHELDASLGLQDLALAVPPEVVDKRLDPVVAELLARLRLGESDGRDLRVAVGDPRDAGVADRGRGEPGDLLRDEDALGESAVGELQARDDVTDGEHVPEVRPAALVGEHEAAVHRETLLVEAEALRRRAASDRDQQQLRFDRVTVLDVHADTGVDVLDRLERRAGQCLDTALAEGPLELL
jgi:hypothetical protein